MTDREKTILKQEFVGILQGENGCEGVICEKCQFYRMCPEQMLEEALEVTNE